MFTSQSLEELEYMWEQSALAAGEDPTWQLHEGQPAVPAEPKVTDREALLQVARSIENGSLYLAPDGELKTR